MAATIDDIIAEMGDLKTQQTAAVAASLQASTDAAAVATAQATASASDAAAKAAHDAVAATIDDITAKLAEIKAGN